MRGARVPKSGAWILAATIIGSSITFIDGTVVNVALPVLQEKLGASGPRYSGWSNRMR